ncbi:MAG: isochorismatase family protein [Desulfobacteraceae bacterium]|nr:isochorismatase family protein [Desulfobacteraceae bacterium]
MNDSLRLLNRDDCVLLLVDLQKSLLDFCVDAGRLPMNAAALVEIAQIMDIPVVLTAQNEEKLGGVLPELTEKTPHTKVLPKVEFNCFDNEVISAVVWKTGRKTLLLAGIEAHICIFQTGAGALREGYRVHVAADAVSSRASFDVQTGLARLSSAGAVISSSEMMIYELLRRAGNKEFRNALPRLKMLRSDY